MDKESGCCCELAVTAVVLPPLEVEDKSNGFCNMLLIKPYSNPIVSDPNPKSDNEKSNICWLEVVVAAAELVVGVA